MGPELLFAVALDIAAWAGLVLVAASTVYVINQQPFSRGAEAPTPIGTGVKNDDPELISPAVRPIVRLVQEFAGSHPLFRGLRPRWVGLTVR